MVPPSEHHRARRLALQGLCALDVQGEKALGGVLAFLRDSRERLSTVAEAEKMLQAAFAARTESDRLLAGESRHWDVARMSLVDRNILRLALWELRAGRTRKKVIMAEAIRLAKEFATAESARFVNGVLDAAARRLERQSGDAGDAGDEEAKN